MKKLMQQLMEENIAAFTHGGKFHADDVFSSALLLYLNPEITIHRGNQVPEEFEGIVFDIGRGAYDHHQRDSRVRENGIPYAAFGLLWEELGSEILGEELAEKFDEQFIQPLDQNDNTGERNELANLIGDFNPSWDEEGNNDEAFFEAVSFAGVVLENKFAKYRGNERADVQVETFLEEQQPENSRNKILVMPKFVPCQKKLSGTEMEFVIFPSNRGGYCIQPLKKEGTMNYKCGFPSKWLGLEKEELQEVTGLQSASFCHKGGFLMTVGELEDAVKACRISQKDYIPSPSVVLFTDGAPERISKKQLEQEIRQMPELSEAEVKVREYPELPELCPETALFTEVAMEKTQWKLWVKNIVKMITREQPEAVVVDGGLFCAYPVIHALRKKKIPVYVLVEREGKRKLVRIPSGS